MEVVFDLRLLSVVCINPNNVYNKLKLIICSFVKQCFILVISLLLSPPQVLKVRLNLQQAGTYHGVVACARSIYRNESLSSFYRGFKPSVLCMIPYAGVECAVHQVRQFSSQWSNIWSSEIFETYINCLLLVAVDHELGKE